MGGILPHSLLARSVPRPPELDAAHRCEHASLLCDRCSHRAYGVASTNPSARTASDLLTSVPSLAHLPRPSWLVWIARQFDKTDPSSSETTDKPAMTLKLLGHCPQADQELRLFSMCACVPQAGQFGLRLSPVRVFQLCLPASPHQAKPARIRRFLTHLSLYRKRSNTI